VRAPIPLQDETRANRSGVTTIVMLCPGNWPGRSASSCKGTASLAGAQKSLPYDMRAGTTAKLRFALKAKTFSKLRRTRRMSARVATSSPASGGATTGVVTVVVRGPR
jgi:hypothetical protein